MVFHSAVHALCPKDSVTQKALQKVLDTLVSAGSGGKGGHQTVVMLDVPYEPEALVRAVAALPTSGDVRLIAWQPFGKPDRSGTNWTKEAARYFEGGPVAFVQSLDELLKSLHSSSDPESLKPVPLDAIRRAQARIIHLDHFKPFSHGGKFDITNQVLAPLRILASAEGESKGSLERELWESFKKLVCKIENYAFWGPNLAAACASVDCLVTSTAGGQTKEKVVESCESIMRILTDIRVASGVPVSADSSDSGGKAPDSRAIEKGSEQCYRVLVVDDHSESWIPVIQHALQTALPEEASVTVDFSNDGEKVCGRELMQVISSYDLVLLDVYLAGNKNGLDVLAQIRKTYHQLPVVLWTSSMDAENPARASRSNGYLFKKTATMAELESAFKHWLPIGLNRRTTSLPNPFFDHVIHDYAARKLLVDMTEWCLKQMDSFHALDGTFFRYFTDHGGRHFVKVLQILENLLAPFVAMKDSPILPDGEKAREEWFVLLYLAVITHELGMFPMRVHGATESFPEVGQDYLNDVRTLHGPRAMVMLADDGYSYWPDDEGRRLATRLTALGSEGRLRKMLAVVVGYHSRYFKSLASERFLKWPGSEDSFLKPVKSTSPYLTAKPELFVKTLKGFTFEDSTKECLRKVCALFRFADALDVTASRNPAQFLCSAPNLPIAQYVENLKRQLCTELTIDNGRVSICLMAESPTASEVVPALELTGPLESQYKKITNYELQQPWKKSGFCMEIHDHLNTWLKSFWSTIAGAPVPHEYSEGLCKHELICVQGNGYASTEKGRKLAAVLGALCMMGDLQSEYQAIKDAGLHQTVTLDTVNWSGYDKNQLSILEVVLQRYQDPSGLT